MPINIVDGSTATVENVVCVIYGVPNAGKSTLGLTASKPLGLDFDRGVHRAYNKHGKSVVLVKSWKDVSDMVQTDVANYDTIVVDTAGTAIDSLIAGIISENPKMGSGGVPSLKGYGELKIRFRGWLNAVRSWGKDVVLICHMKEEKKGEETVERIVATGASRDEIYQSADIMGRLFFENGKRKLSFDPTSHSYAKNVGLDEYEVIEGNRADDLLARIIADAKQLINDNVEAQNEEAERMAKRRDWIMTLHGDAAVFNEARQKMTGPDVRVVEKQLLVDRAKSCNVIYDKEQKTFVDVKPEPAPEPEAADQGKDPFAD